MHANVYLFWGQVEPRREPSQQQKDRAGERERAPIYSTVVQLQLRHECILNQRDSGGKVKWEQPCQQMFPRCDMESHFYQSTSAALSPLLRPGFVIQASYARHP